MRTRLIAFLILIGQLTALKGQMQPAPEPEFSAMGGGYEYLDDGFITQVIYRSAKPEIKILVLPVAYASNPEAITDEERAQNLSEAEARRIQIQDACDRMAPPGKICQVELAPVFTASDVSALPVEQFVSENLDGVFFLGGDQAIAIQVITGSRLESALENAFLRGAIIGGTSAGAAIQSKTMIAGYTADKDVEQSMDFGSVDIWNTAEHGGLPMGIQLAVIDQHFFQRGRFPRLLNSISLPDVPHIGIGIDAYTGTSIRNHRYIENIFGRTAVAILDGETYHAANGVQYFGDNNIVSLRNVLFHLLPPGNLKYDLENRTVSSRSPISQINRDDDQLRLPKGAGNIYIGGGLLESEAKDSAINQFLNAAGGLNARILTIASGYSNRSEAQRDAAKYTSALGGVVNQTKILLSGSPVMEELPDNITGIMLIGRDQSRIQPDLFPIVREAWLSGIPVLADDAGAAVIGQYYGMFGPTPPDETTAEPFTQGTLTQGTLPISPGLGFFDAMFEPRLINNNRWGRIVSLAYNHSGYQAIGLPEGTYLALTPNSAQVFGRNGVAILDLSLSSLSLGENRAFAIVNGLLDIFGPGELLQFSSADSDAAPVRAATPINATSTPGQTATLPPTGTPTPPSLPTVSSGTSITPSPRAPRATATNEIIAIEEKYEDPPPTDISLLHAMILFGAAMTLTVLVGVWINRGQINMR